MPGPDAVIRWYRDTVWRARDDKLHALTSLRFIAAAMIVVVHCSGGLGPDVGNGRWILVQAVSLFFVLSGFILTYVYPSLDGIGPGRFLLSRIARIWPAHITGLLFVMVLFGYVDTMERTVANVLLLHSWIPLRPYVVSYNPPSWSISVELAFYLCFPGLIRSFPRTWALKLSLSLLLAVGLIAVGNLAALPVSASQGVGLDTLVYSSPLVRGFEFIVGMVMALWRQRLVGRVRVSPAAGTLLELATVGLAAGALVASVGSARWLSALPLIGAAGEVWLSSCGAVSSVPFGVLILVLSFERGYVSRLLGWRPFVLLGELSYAMYLLHYTLIRYHGIRGDALSGLPSWLVLALFWLVLLLASHLVWLLVERPCRRWIVALWPRPSVARPRIAPLGSSQPSGGRLAPPTA